jgi:hypothetical protein
VVLMGFAEALAAIEVAWSLQAAGFTVAAFRRAGSSPALKHVKGVQLYEVPAPEHDAAATVAAIDAIARRVRPSAMLPLDDQTVWLFSRQDQPPAPIAGGSGSAAEYALDKSMQVQVAREAGLAVPATKVVDDLRNADALEWPIIVKPARAVYEANGRMMRPTGTVCANTTEFERALGKQWLGPVLIQPLISGVGEGLFGHMSARGVLGWSAHRRVRMVNPQGSASSACRSAPVDEALLRPAARFLNAIGWRGMFMLEFLRDADGTPWFMELNGRAWGSMALARRRGLEYPAWTVRAAVAPGYEPSVPAAPPEVLCRNLGLELVRLMFVARGPRSDAQQNWPRLGESARELTRWSAVDRLYNWNSSQPRVLLADTLGTLGHYLRAAARRRS